jgi:hypothetical protein
LRWRFQLRGRFHFRDPPFRGQRRWGCQLRGSQPIRLALLLLTLAAPLPAPRTIAAAEPPPASRPGGARPNDASANGAQSNGAQPPASPLHGAAAEAGTPAAAEPRPLPRETTDRDEERRRAYTMGMVMIGGILICGVGLIAAALLWGSRARRIARQPLPRIAPRDELWYLKNKPDPPTAADTQFEERDTPPA